MKTYTSTEIAEVLRVDAETIRRYLLAGKIKGIKIGNTWRVTEEEFQKFMRGE